MKAMVVEDSLLAREGLMSMLAAYPDIELIGSADHPDSALPLLQETKADVLFLDIHMPGSTGFDLLESLPYAPLVIFTTAYSEHAIRSFDFNTVDYLLKPISPERLYQAIAKLRNQVVRKSEAAEQLHDQLLDINSRMFIRDSEKCFLVDLKSVRYFETCKNYARLYFEGDNAYIKRSLNQLEKRLPPNQFFRANRQYIVNLEAVESIGETMAGGQTLVMNDGKEIEVARRRFESLKELLSF